MSSDPIEVLRERLRDYAEGLAAPVTLHAEDVAELTALIRDALASLSAPKPSGEWVLVPREPSREMEAAAEKHRQEAGGWPSKDPWTWAGAFRAMLAAAPKPESAEAVGEVFGPKALSTMVALERPLPPGTKLYTAPPRPEASAPVGVEGWSVAPVEDDPDMLAVETPDGRTWFAKRGDRVFELAEALALAQQPAADGGFTAADMMDARQEGRKEAQQPAAVDDSALLDALAREYWKLDPFDMPTPGGDDADVGWRVIQYHRGHPHEREVAVHYGDDPRAALRAALAGQQGGTSE